VRQPVKNAIAGILEDGKNNLPSLLVNYLMIYVKALKALMQKYSYTKFINTLSSRQL